MSYLKHHGIKGMKWGVRRFQKKDGSLTPAGKERYSKEGSARASSDGDGRSSANAFVSKNSSRSVSDAKAGVGEEYIAMAVVYTAIYGGIFLAAKAAEKRERTKKTKELEDLKDNRDIKSFDECPKLKEKMSPAESAKVINPEYPSEGTTMNCTFCTTAMALREKGYNVKASKLSDGWYSDDLFNATFKSPEVKMKGKKSSSEVLKELSSMGDGAYGNLIVNWKLGGAHSIFWKNENGVTNIYDAQSGKAYESFSDKNALLGNVNLSNIRYNRLDNCEPTDYALAIVERAEKGE